MKNILIIVTLSVLAGCATMTSQQMNKQALYYHSQGVAFETKSEWDAAANAYREALSVINNYPWSMLGLANIYLYQEKYDLAIQEYLDIIKTNPSFELIYQVHDDLGVVYFHQKKYDLAKAEYQYSITLSPRFAHAYNNLGSLYEIQGDYQRALELYHQAQAIGGDQVTDGNIDRVLKLMNKSGNQSAPASTSTPVSTQT